MVWDWGKFFMALAIAIVVGIVLTAILGPAISTIKVPIANIVGDAFTKYGFAFGILAGIGYYFGYKRGTV